METRREAKLIQESFSPSKLPSAMACRSSSLSIYDADIIFPKRSSNLSSIFAHDKAYNKHRATLKDWSKRYEASERNLVRKQANCSSARSDLYQILGLFFVFQGVVLTAVAQANLLRCHNWILPFILCLLTSLAAFGACLQKLMEIAEFKEQHRLEKALYLSLHKSIDKLKEEGIDFDVEKGQPDLAGKYTKEEYTGKGTLDGIRSSVSQFCSVWVFSYAGAVLLLLCVFSGVTLFSIHQILCNSGHSSQ